MIRRRRARPPADSRPGAEVAPAEAEEIARRGVSGPGTDFPHRNRIEESLGGPITASAHADERAAAAADRLGAEAFAFGDAVAFRSPAPSLELAAHEAAHTLQPSRASGVGGEREPAEDAADAFAGLVAAGEAGADLSTAAGPRASIARFPADRALHRHDADDHTDHAGVGDGARDPGAGKNASHRFEGDERLDEIHAGAAELGRGDRGIPVVKLQQALIDMGYLLPAHGVDGSFGEETEEALKQFQSDAGVADSGRLDQQTLVALRARFGSRRPYLDNAARDPANPGAGTRRLNAEQRAAANAAMAPARGTGGRPATFTEEVGGQRYGNRMRVRLTDLVARAHQRFYRDREPLRADPANLHDWSTLEGTAGAAKDVTDAVYGSYAHAGAPSNAAGTLVDGWEDEVAANAALSPDEEQAKARRMVWYLVVANCADINDEHGAIVTESDERAILEPIVESFVDTPAKVQIMLEIEIGWPGAELEGTIYLQRFKAPDAAGNRARLWRLFHTCIHEYLHALVHDDFAAYAERHRRRGDTVRYNTLIEGFCDFFTENVRATVSPTPALRAQVEGPYHDPAAAVPAVTPSAYPSRAQAEQVVSIVGVRNAQAAYFRGEVRLIGGR